VYESPLIGGRTFVSRAATARVRNLRDQPAYPLHEAARYARVVPATLRTWVLGRKYQTSAGPREWPRLITPADQPHCLLSFNNLVEAHVLRSLRTMHGSQIPQIRSALRYAAQELGIDRLLLSRELQTGGGDLFIERLGQLINLSQSGQLALKAVLEQHLKRVARDSAGLPIKLFPFVLDDGRSGRVIAIDPAIGFGRPIVASKGIATQTIVERIDAGEALEALADDYGMPVEELTEAILYERAA